MIYALFMSLATLTAWGVSRLTPNERKPPLLPSQKLFIGLIGFSAAVFFAKLPFLLLNENLLNHAGGLLFSGKSILFGIVGGYLGVELAKAQLHIRVKTGDSFVLPVATAIGVGRLGCFFSGCCHGTPTELPWAVVFPHVDALSRHPTQLYECAFHLAAACTAFRLLRAGRFRGQLIKLYFLAYFAFRFATEFIRPEIDWRFGLSAYQWAICLFVPIFIFLWIRDAKRLQLQEQARNA